MMLVLLDYQAFIATLGPLETWRLRNASVQASEEICLERLEWFRKAWSQLDIRKIRCFVKWARDMTPEQPPSSLLRDVGCQLLLEPAAIFAKDDSDSTILSWAADYGFHDVIKLLVSPLAQGMYSKSLSQIEKNGWYPLFRAAWNGRSACVENLLIARASVDGLESDACSKTNYTPLMAASRWGHARVVELLLLSRANLELRNRFGDTALGLAISQRHSAVAQMIKNSMQDQSECFQDSDPPVFPVRRTMGQGWAALGWGDNLCANP